MSRVIVITSGKGGVGKTTITANLGVALASSGYKVCLLDADLGLKNLGLILGIECRVIFDIQDVIEGVCTLEKALVKEKKNINLSILPACKSLDVQKIDFTYMQKIVNELKKSFDFILIDSPAGIERGFFNSIKSATEALMVITLDISAIRDADKVIGILNNNGINDVKVIVNKVNPNSIATNASLSIEDALEVLSVPLIGVVYEEDIIQYSNNNATAAFYNQKSMSHKCFSNISRRLQGEQIDICKFKRKNIFSRLLN